MAIPNYQQLMAPLLQSLSDNKVCTLSQLEELVATVINLSDHERQQWYPSGNQRIFRSRLSWAGTYLKKAGALNASEKGKYQISERGKQLLANHPDHIDNAILKQFQEFETYLQTDSGTSDTTDDAPFSNEIDKQSDPISLIEAQFGRLQRNLKDELLAQIKDCSPAFFERLVVELLFKMGYGGTHQELEEAVVGKSGDEGIDGLIKEDPLGLQEIYVQAKRYTNMTVGRRELQSFTGSMEGFHATRGVFFTASTFSSTVKPYLEKVNKKIILIDGEGLTELMLKYNVGVTATTTYAIQQLDMDYFLET